MSSHGIPFRKGDDPRRGKAKGSKPTDKFRQWCRKAVDDKVVQGNIRTILADHKHPQFVKLWATLSEFGHGAALKTYQVTGDMPVLKVIDSE